ncbi:pyridoxamine 5'-phosphate oxidase family protein [Ornithinimicrobium sp. Arc0846-15]|nr:pyridoxamine 5'-phosphate oxidase family protein [Ornithinimicrobium laminariae]
MTSELGPTKRTKISRGKSHAQSDRAILAQVLGEGLIAHVGYQAGSHPVVLPMAYAFDLNGPDIDGTLYLHGSVAAMMLRHPQERQLCATITLLDGLVAARSGFEHSMNYRTAVIIGSARLVTSESERLLALDLIVDQMIPGRATTLRPATRKELSATAVIALPLHEASVKISADGPEEDEPSDIAAGTWGGHIPLRFRADAVVTDTANDAEVPSHIVERVTHLS